MILKQNSDEKKVVSHANKLGKWSLFMTCLEGCARHEVVYCHAITPALYELSHLPYLTLTQFNGFKMIW